MIYQHFAGVYDQLMEDVPYYLWVDFFEKKVKEYLPGEPKSKEVLDVGCGTGTLSLRLAEKGYHLTGIDLSTDMLAVAQKKADDKRLPISFFHQNMKDLSGFQPFDAIFIFCDSLNYLKTEEEVQSTFKQVYKHLKSSGLFMFDVHSIYKMNDIFINNTFASNEEKVSFIWHCLEGEYSNSVEHDLSFFLKEGETYTRFDECHEQRTFPAHEYEKWLKDVGFEVLGISGDFSTELNEKSERIFFTCRKK